jgi:hypothetical protein
MPCGWQPRATTTRLDLVRQRGTRPLPATPAPISEWTQRSIAPVTGHDHDQMLPVRPQRRRMELSAMLNNVCTRMPMSKITMMIAVALCMSA